MDIEFDPNKDRINIGQHHVSLARAADMVVLATIEDHRFAGEQRYRLYGTIDGIYHCLAAVFRSGRVRAISLRRAHLREYGRYVPPTRL